MTFAWLHSIADRPLAQVKSVGHSAANGSISSSLSKAWQGLDQGFDWMLAVGIETGFRLGAVCPVLQHIASLQLT